MEPLNALLKGVIIRAINSLKMSKRWIMKAKFSEDNVSVNDLKINPGKTIRQIQEARRFMRGLLKGMVDLEEGREQSLKDVKNHLKISIEI
jgi:hypothetical protein